MFVVIQYAIETRQVNTPTHRKVAVNHPHINLGRFHVHRQGIVNPLHHAAYHMFALHLGCNSRNLQFTVGENLDRFLRNVLVV